MSKILVIIWILLMMLPTFIHSLFAQTRVTGHVFAEVVESIGVTSNTNNMVVVTPGTDKNGFDLGKISLTGGSMATYDLIIESNGIFGESGMLATFSAKTDYNRSFQMLDLQGKKILQLYGSTNCQINTGNEKILTAEYNLVFAYN